MYKSYFVNRQTDNQGDHEVHVDSCSNLPSISNRMLLGQFTNCKDAVAEAKKTYSTANGCYWCSNECHTS